jgi:hypothetical protein
MSQRIAASLFMVPHCTPFLRARQVITSRRFNGRDLAARPGQAGIGAHKLLNCRRAR